MITYKAQQDHWQPTRPFFLVLAVAGNDVFDHLMPALHYTVGFRVIGWCDFTANHKKLALLASIGECELRSLVG